MDRLLQLILVKAYDLDPKGTFYIRPEFDVIGYQQIGHKLYHDKRFLMNLTELGNDEDEILEELNKNNSSYAGCFYIRQIKTADGLKPKVQMYALCTNVGEIQEIYQLVDNNEIRTLKREDLEDQIIEVASFENTLAFITEQRNKIKVAKFDGRWYGYDPKNNCVIDLTSAETVKNLPTFGMDMQGQATATYKDGDIYYCVLIDDFQTIEHHYRHHWLALSLLPYLQYVAECLADTFSSKIDISLMDNLRDISKSPKDKALAFDEVTTKLVIENNYKYEILASLHRGEITKEMHIERKYIELEHIWKMLTGEEGTKIPTLVSRIIDLKQECSEHNGFTFHLIGYCSIKQVATFSLAVNVGNNAHLLIEIKQPKEVK